MNGASCRSARVLRAITVYSWGCTQSSGQPPPGGQVAALVPGLAHNGSVSSIAAGEYHVVVALKRGGVLVWGAGVGSTTPVPVRGLPATTAIAVAAGYQHSLAVMACDEAAAAAEDSTAVEKIFRSSSS